MKASHERGFTLIELVVVITILGILAAFAVPRFIALDSQARAATVNGLAGSVKSAASLARGLAMATNTGASGTVTMEGQTITLNNFYPDSSTIAKAVNSDNTNDWAFTAGTATTVSTWTKVGSGTPANCAVSYLPATSSAPPVVAAVTSGC
ncbi:MAG: prepilin-type N-terminal cleavage/methylation domain-containing protein [Proteobacteria bacterium]|nr:prepilin-type N-terminal cleavage/methylation domain-containing protein [Pseudomonadota bacterium]